MSNLAARISSEGKMHILKYDIYTTFNYNGR